MPDLKPPFRPAVPGDADVLARLINRASEGISYDLWSRAALPGQDPWEVGRARAVRETGGFSYRNAVLYELEGTPVGLLMGYRLPDPYPQEDMADVPDLVRPLVELEALAPGSWYVNAIAVFPQAEGRGIGRALMDLAECLARGTGAPEMSLIVAEENIRALTLYRRLGYSPRERRPAVPFAGFPHKGDWLLMAKPLAG